MHVELNLLTIQGKQLKNVLNEQKEAGEYSVKTDVSELPTGTYLYQIKAGLLNETKKLIVIEEHQGECGLRETLSYHLTNSLNTSIKILSLSASGYPGGKYGDQKFHQEENKLAGENLEKALRTFLF